MRRVLVIDTSMLCCWLKVPGKETSGKAQDLWDFNRIETLLKKEAAMGSTFVLPIATLIETGNHIAQASEYRFERASALCQHLQGALDAKNPWAAFTQQADLWKEDHLALLAQNWPSLAASKLSIGDATIKDVAEYYAKADCYVEILTGDAGLRAYQPATPTVQPRRRR